MQGIPGSCTGLGIVSLTSETSIWCLSTSVARVSQFDMCVNIGVLIRSPLWHSFKLPAVVALAVPCIVARFNFHGWCFLTDVLLCTWLKDVCMHAGHCTYVKGEQS
jgi:hypothetical protein